MDTDSTVRDLGGRTKALVVLLVLGIAAGVVSLASSWLQYQLLSRDYTDAEADANDAREQAVGCVELPLRLATVVVFGMWIYRANHNVRAVGARGLRYTPGWAVGWFFVPVLNLWKPYQAMSDLWRASRQADDWEDTAPGQILPVWWSLWLLAAFAGNAAFRVELRAKTIEELKAATVVEMVSGGLDLLLSLAAIVLVTQITGFQRGWTDGPPDRFPPTPSPRD